MVIVDDHRAFHAEKLHTIRLSHRRPVRGKHVTHAEAEGRTVGERDDRPRDVVGVVAGARKNPALPTRDDLRGRIAFEQPAYEIDVIGEHVEHGCRVRIALEDVHRDRTAVVDARHAADDFTQPALPHLLLRAKKTFLVAAAVSDAEIAARASHGVEHRVGVAQRERDRLLDENGFTQLERAPHRRRMLAFGCRDDYGRHFRTLDDFGVVRRNELRACQFGETARTGDVPIRHRQIAHRRMLRSETRAQRPDAPGTHDGKADVLAARAC